MGHNSRIASQKSFRQTILVLDGVQLYRQGLQNKITAACLHGGCAVRVPAVMPRWIRTWPPNMVSAWAACAAEMSVWWVLKRLLDSPGFLMERRLLYLLVGLEEVNDHVQVLGDDDQL